MMDDLTDEERENLAAEVFKMYEREERSQTPDVVFPEETPTVLSDRNRNRFLELINNPPLPNAALRKAFSRHRKQQKDSQ
jgi:Protein of unknown function (DUF1778)